MKTYRFIIKNKTKLDRLESNLLKSRFLRPSANNHQNNVTCHIRVEGLFFYYKQIAVIKMLKVSRLFIHSLRANQSNITALHKILQSIQHNAIHTIFFQNHGSPMLFPTIQQSFVHIIVDMLKPTNQFSETVYSLYIKGKKGNWIFAL